VGVSCDVWWGNWGPPSVHLTRSTSMATIKSDPGFDSGFPDGSESPLDRSSLAPKLGLGLYGIQLLSASVDHFARSPE